MSESRRWPATVMAVLFVGYAVGKAARAREGRLGFPGGPPVSAADADRYPLDPVIAQTLACVSGLVAAGIVLATVTSLGRRLPRWVILIALAAVVLPVAAGAAIMSLDGFIGLGIGWRWYHGVVGIVCVALSLETLRSYVAATRRTHG
ncbi:hypothetical protein ACFV9C_13160 [Kribbella sp. NPDC059898]|uniref:hypothetical protein n=1 Tax=Kribbella sp. NPDC059898 TaxID=3346995 RepID=UPI0036581D2C